MKQDLNELMSKPVNRLDFLKHVGVGIAAVAGVGTIVDTLSTLNSKKKVVASGYGASVYGGVKTTNS